MSRAKIIVNVNHELEELVPQFLINRQKDLSAIFEQLELGNAEALSKLGHKIKGTAASYGFQELSQLAAEIENLGKSGSIDGIMPLAKKMQAYLDSIEIHYIKEAV